MKDLIIDIVIVIINIFWFVIFLGSFISVIAAAAFYFNLLNVFDDIKILKLENRIKRMNK